MRIAIATDAWFPQVNGVVRTLAATVAELDRRGYETSEFERGIHQRGGFGQTTGVEGSPHAWPITIRCPGLRK